MTLMGVGELGNFAAYGFAPASLIAPLGCVSVIGKCDLFLFLYTLSMHIGRSKKGWVHREQQEPLPCEVYCFASDLVTNRHIRANITVHADGLEAFTVLFDI